MPMAQKRRRDEPERGCTALPRSRSNSRPPASGTAARSLAAALAAVVVAGCGEASQAEETWEEALPAGGLPAEQVDAYRITLFRYERRVGGFVEYFEVDGVRNTRLNPYFSVTACGYFGDGDMVNGRFPIEVELQGEPVTMTATQERRSLAVDIEGDTREFVRVGRAARRQCPGGR